jgi:5-hydroxyisourate hydrolase-like protein (transthyretin family)
MRTLLIFAWLFSAATLFSQPALKYTDNLDYNYGKEWAAIDSLINVAGQPAAAKERVTTLMDDAKGKGNWPQYVKACLFESNLVQQIDPEDEFIAIRTLHTHYELATGPERSFLAYSLGTTLLGRANNYNTNTTDVAERSFDNLTSWSAKQFLEVAYQLFDESVSDNDLKTLAVKSLNALTVYNEKMDYLRPSVWHFLAFQVLEQYTNNDVSLTQPVYRFSLNQPEAFESAATFSRFDFASRDSLSRIWLATKLYQEVIADAINGSNQEMLADADYLRGKFVHSNSTLSNKDDRALAFWQAYADNYTASKNYRAKAYYEQAMILINKPYDIGDMDQKNRFAIRDAKEKLTLALTFAVDKDTKLDISNQINQIEQKEVMMHNEEVVLPNKPILARITWKNTETFTYKIHKLTDKRNIDRHSYERKKLLKDSKLIATNTVSLPNMGDLRQHSTEISLGKLDFGWYMIEMLDLDGKVIDDESNNFEPFQVTNLAMMMRSGEQNEIIVVDRTTGEPLVGVQVDVFLRTYNQSTYEQELKPHSTLKTNESGRAYPKSTNDKEYQNLTFRIYKGLDAYYSSQDASLYPYRPEVANNDIEHFSHIFLDRAIYRPGQTVYFKSIVIEKQGANRKAAPGRDVKFSLFDANGTEVAIVNQKTNDFGSCTGQFILPEGLLNGYFRLANDHNCSISFQVEEYKRPKFEVTFDTLAGGYKLGQTVKVKGKSRSYAGAPVAGAQVAYRVTRETIYPCLPWYKMAWFYSYSQRFGSSNIELASGIATTNQDGSFEISVTLLDDPGADTSLQPAFNYRVVADITDLNGETRSSRTLLNAGYISMSLTLDIDERINRRDAKPLALVAKNLMGSQIKARGTVTVHKLNAPEQYFTNRLWEKPDTNVITKADFKANFPDFAYAGEDEAQNFPKGELLDKRVFDTELSGSVYQAEFKKWKPGFYLIEATSNDPFGVEVKQSKVVQIFDPADNKFTGIDKLWSQVSDQVIEPGDTLRCIYGSRVPKLHMLIELERKMKIENSQWVLLNGQDVVEFDIEEQDRGGFCLSGYSFYNNRWLSFQHVINVPYSNKKLDIRYETFRDKLEPGQQEQWRLRITGPNKDAATAELLALMYDASLDAFATHNLNLSWWDQNPMPTRSIVLVWHNANGLNRYWTKSSEYINDPAIRYRAFNEILPASYSYNYGRGGTYRGNNYPMPAMAMTESAAAPTGAVKYKNSRVGDASAAAASMEDSATNDLKFTSAVPTAPPPPSLSGSSNTSATPPPAPRTNLKETVFFLPQLKTDKNGDILIDFKMNEALTRWKFLALAHTPDLKSGQSERMVTTSKTMMVQPNPPRFMRGGDELGMAARISNTSSETLNGQATLEILDGNTETPLDWVKVKEPIKFTIAPNATTSVEWLLNVPNTNLPEGVIWRVMATAGTFGDGESAALPILPNEMLITESMPLPLKPNESRSIDLQKLMGDKPGGRPHALSLEVYDNPIWLAVQSLPYLTEYPYNCTEQIFSRLVANSLTLTILGNNPEIEEVYKAWEAQPGALQSKLLANPDLKTAIIEATPWVREAASETDRMLALKGLFDSKKAIKSFDKDVQQLRDRQLGNGGFTWFPNGPDNYYITLHILNDQARLTRWAEGKLPVVLLDEDQIKRSLTYCDDKMTRQYDLMLKQKGFDPNANHLGTSEVIYLHILSQYPDHKPKKQTQPVIDFYRAQSEKYWLSQSLHDQGIIALTWQTAGNPKAMDIMRSLRDKALTKPELGMYWPMNRGGYGWGDYRIETQCVMAEVFEKVAKDTEAATQIRLWLLKNKQTSQWGNSKATAAAVFTLLEGGNSDKLVTAQPIGVTLGGSDVQFSNPAVAALGYRRTKYDATQLASVGTELKLTNPNNLTTWGAAYYQYYAPLDEVQKPDSSQPVQIKKTLTKRILTDRGEAIEPIKEDGSNLHIGDLVRVKLEISADRSVDFVHLRDQRASTLEPTQVISSYRWETGLGYYMSTRDASTDFFIDRLPKGNFVIEYDLRVERVGDFSSGPATINCMYAPEFSNHSEGRRVIVSK